MKAYLFYDENEEKDRPLKTVFHIIFYYDSIDKEAKFKYQPKNVNLQRFEKLVICLRRFLSNYSDEFIYEKYQKLSECINDESFFYFEIVVNELNKALDNIKNGINFRIMQKCLSHI